MKFIKQKKTDEELNQISYTIIDLLEDCNISEKYKIISTLKSSLKDIIKSMGGNIIEVVPKK